MDNEILKVAALAAVCSWGLIEAIKPNIKKLAPDSWARTGVRLAALIIGAGLGFCMKCDPMGAAAGASGAALSSLIVAAIRKKLK